MKFETHLEVGQPEAKAGSKAVEILSNETSLSRQTVKQAMHKGAVWLTRKKHTQRIRRADKQLQLGDQLHLYYDEKVLSENPPEAAVIADEMDYSILYKPYGMLSQGSKWGDHCTINRWAETKIKPQRPAFIVHRLDRAARGLILLAHKKKTAAFFADLFQQRNVEKKYQAIVTGKFPASLSMDTPIDQQSAFSQAKLITFNPTKNESLLEVNIETGRKHQIRKHLSQAGYPIIGDRLYGQKDQSRDLQLASCYLAFSFSESRRVYTLPSSLQLTL